MSQQTPPLESQDSLVTAIRLFQEGLRAAKRAYEERVAPALIAFLEGMQRLPDEVRPAVRALAERGWYISGEMGASELWELARTVGDSERLDLIMAGWVRGELPEIQKRASERFPHRASILCSAFAAHNSSAFELSVPVILIQVEGMCVEILGSKLYSATKGIPRTKAATNILVDGAFSEVMLQPLREPYGLTAGEKERAMWPNAPNRHEILHGKDIGYGSELNSLKAISLLEYFVTFVARRKLEMSDCALPPGT